MKLMIQVDEYDILCIMKCVKIIENTFNKMWRRGNIFEDQIITISQGVSKGAIVSSDEVQDQAAVLERVDSHSHSLCKYLEIDQS